MEEDGEDGGRVDCSARESNWLSPHATQCDPVREGLQEQVLPFAQNGTPCAAYPVNAKSN